MRAGVAEAGREAEDVGSPPGNLKSLRILLKPGGVQRVGVITGVERR